MDREAVKGAGRRVKGGKGHLGAGVVAGRRGGGAADPAKAAR